MADAPSDNSPATFGSGEYNYSITTPDVMQRHDISDEELTMVSSGNRTFVQDVMWVSLGAFLGALVPAISAIEEFNQSSSTFNKWDLIECLVCFAALVVFIVTCLIKGVAKDDGSDRVQAIRDRSSK